MRETLDQKSEIAKNEISILSNEFEYEKKQEMIILQELSLLMLEKEAKQSDLTFSKMMMGYGEMSNIQKLKQSAKIIKDNILILNYSYFYENENNKRKEVRDELEKLKKDYKNIFLSIFEIKRKGFEEHKKKYIFEIEEKTTQIEKLTSNIKLSFYLHQFS